MDILISLLQELQPFILNGLWVSIICTFLFMVFKFPARWSETLKTALMHFIIFLVALGWALLVASNPEWPFREKLALWIKIVAFSFLFYELVGRYLIKKLFHGYRIKAEKRVEENQN